MRSIIFEAPRTIRAGKWKAPRPGHGEVLVSTRAAGACAGDAAVVEPFVGCGTCYPCRAGRPNCCANLKIIGAHFPDGRIIIV